jgi:glycerol kinase
MAAAEAKVGTVKVVAVGITNQRETTVAWDKATGMPLHNAIVWHDTRTSHMCQELTKLHGKVMLQAASRMILMRDKIPVGYDKRSLSCNGSSVLFWERSRLNKLNL